jgi:hypothetical protein
MFLTLKATKFIVELSKCDDDNNNANTFEPMVAMMTDNVNTILHRQSQVRIANFLFRNESLYILMKKIFKLRHLKTELKKLIDFSHLSQMERDQSKRRGTVLLPINNDINTNQIDDQINTFCDRFSFNFIESWYFGGVSSDDQFVIESKSQLKMILTQVIKRFLRSEKLQLFSGMIHLANNNFINASILNSTTQTPIPMTELHPAIQNSPHSETFYMKRFVQIILRACGSKNLNLNQFVVEEILVQVICKTSMERLIQLLIQPNFIYYCIAMIIDYDKTTEMFTQTDNADNSKISDNETNVKFDLQLDNDTTAANESQSKKENDPRPQGTQTQTAINDDKINNERELTNRQSFRNLLAAHKRKGSEVTSSKLKSSTFFDYEIQNSNMKILFLIVSSAEKSYEPGTGNSYTLYNIKVNNLKKK